MSLTTPGATKNLWRLWKAGEDAARRGPGAAPWRVFLEATAGLGLSLFLALYATALSEQGEFRFAAFLAATALILAGLVAVRSLPFLARQVAKGRVKLRFEYHLTREGLAYLFVIFVIAIAALNTGNNLLFLILAIMLAAIVGSGVLSKIVLSGIGLEMSLPPHIFAQQSVACRLKLRNNKKFFPSYSLTVSPAEPPRSSWRQKSGSLQDNPRILTVPVYIPYIPKDSAIEQEIELRFPHRGRYTQNGFTLSSKFPFGFIRKTRKIATQHDLLVLPEVAPLDSFRAIPPALAGEIQSMSRNDRGHDLYGLRDYQQSDSAHNIDWKATARTQRLKLREFSREDDRRIRLILDHRLPSLSAPDLEKFERAVRLCASLAWHFAAQGAFLEFATAGLQIVAAHGEDAVYSILEALATIEAHAGNDTDGLDYSAIFPHFTSPAIILTADADNPSLNRLSATSIVIPIGQI